VICPKCKSRAIGKIGQNQYYCWDCNIEFVTTKDGYRMYRLESDGTLLPESLEDAESGAILEAIGSQSMRARCMESPSAKSQTVDATGTRSPEVQLNVKS